MGSNNPHNKIIKQQCKEILLPVGVFQRGSSRVYVDDNGYFFTLIEFQPSSWSKGTYLNLAIHFLWNEREFLSYDFSFNGSRVKSYAAYLNDAQFEQAVKEYAAFAREQVLFYRELRKVEKAKEYAQKWARQYPKHPHVQELKKLWRLDEEEILQKIRRTRAFWRAQPAMKKMPRYAPYD